MKQDFSALKGKNVGLITNHTAITTDSRHIIDVFLESTTINLAALFSPEHGLEGTKENGDTIFNSDLTEKGIPIFSLYGSTKKPLPDMLRNIDVLVFDIQDIGARFYTYISTMSLAMEAAAEQNIPFVVLDRPNPLGGIIVEGPMLIPQFKSFVGMHTIPVRHGMTVGELATMFNNEGWLKNDKVDLQVIKINDWQRKYFWPDWQREWTAPSPNIPQFSSALVYPGMAFLEGTNVSEGRGTRQPFVKIGAPWIDASILKNEMLKIKNKGIAFDTTSFVPKSIPGMSSNPKYLDHRCNGLMLQVTNAEQFLSVRFGISLIYVLYSLFPDEFRFDERWFNLLAGNDDLVKSIKDGKSLSTVLETSNRDVEKFKQMRQKYLLY